MVLNQGVLLPRTIFMSIIKSLSKKTNIFIYGNSELKTILEVFIKGQYESILVCSSSITNKEELELLCRKQINLMVIIIIFI